ncbi:MAG TPA: HD domain-containing protein [Pelagibacterium sp.]|uniref:HD domain-containing protein n=1 Tax=Pelagibacterium sp. TaxID=1967288 RepID=UPI002CE2C9F0|nr:HD domain-containing protein [Pelagibacterium sp.]HWJ88033.1 HD domain-containing protein [Pelagibacterium sp.]
MSVQRIRDPIHGLISFDLNDPIEAKVWEIIKAPEFQRLRHIRQLGVSEFVFPSATHTRFAHSIGVFHNARRLMKVIERDEGKRLDKARKATALIAAVVHDVGHGPFSHAFEVAREAIAKERGIEVIKKHEAFSASMITNPDGSLMSIIENGHPGLAAEVSDLIKADNPIDIYHAVVSSSFDADRLDYLVRDRHMTGVECGSIEQEWLIDNLIEWNIDVSQDDDEPRIVRTFVFKAKGRQAAEDFLLARYRLYSQLYLHKTTRGFEQIIGAILLHIARNWDRLDVLGLEPRNPFIRFFTPGGETLANYAALNDSVFWATTRTLAESGDERSKLLAGRLLMRKRLKVLDVSVEFGHDPAQQANAEMRLDQYLEDQLGWTVFKDTAPNHLYGVSGGESAKAHQMVRVVSGGTAIEITDFPDTIINEWLRKKKNLVRYYFLEDAAQAEAERFMRGR